jgi:hypothetical protein
VAGLFDFLEDALHLFHLVAKLVESNADIGEPEVGVSLGGDRMSLSRRYSSARAWYSLPGASAALICREVLRCRDTIHMASTIATASEMSSIDSRVDNLSRGSSGYLRVKIAVGVKCRCRGHDRLGCQVQREGRYFVELHRFSVL